MIESVLIRQATKQGTVKWSIGGVADLSFPTSKTRRGRVQGDGNICPTLMANNQDLFKLEADEVKKYRIRKLTPRECWRLMGFSDEDYEKAEAVNSATQLYAQAGNSIVVNVLEAIFSGMVDQGNTVLEGEMMKKEGNQQMQVPKESSKEVEEEMEMESVQAEQCEVQKAAGEKIIREFKEDLKDSNKVKLMGSINSGNFMIHINDAVDILESVILRERIG